MIFFCFEKKALIFAKENSRNREDKTRYFAMHICSNSMEKNLRGDNPDVEGKIQTEQVDRITTGTT